MSQTRPPLLAVTHGSTRGRRRGPLPATAASTGNSILAALLATEYKHLLPKLEHVVLKRGETVYRADQRIEAVYFPEDAVVARVDSMANGRTVEVGIIGREGLLGINIFLGGMVTPDKAIVQLSGGAMRMRAKDLRKEVRFGSPLQRLLLSYGRAFLAVISQSVACSQHHDVEQRLARLLLTMSHYAGSRELLMVHESIAALLGVRRAGVTVAASNLQMAGLISYRRGRISILDRRGLQRRSCECYRFISGQYEQLQLELRRVLFHK
jgi:CRP-like cAMP-binding protein